MNLLAATVSNEEATDEIYNVAAGGRTTLNQLYYYIRNSLSSEYSYLENVEPNYRDFRAGDVRHSQADIIKAKKILGYAPTHQVQDGLIDSIKWYVNKGKSANK